jgi:hypothetical protein
MHHPSRVLPFFLLFACVLLLNCQPSGDNANTNANTNHAANGNAVANVEQRSTPEVRDEQSRAPSPTPSPTPIDAKFCNETSLGRFLPSEIKSATSSDTSCLKVRPLVSGTGGGVPVVFHCENDKANCTAKVTVTYEPAAGKRPDVYTINCTP